MWRCISTNIGVGAYGRHWILILGCIAAGNTSDENGNDDLIFSDLIVEDDTVLAVSLFVGVILNLAANLLPLGNWEVAVNAGVN